MGRNHLSTPEKLFIREYKESNTDKEYNAAAAAAKSLQSCPTHRRQPTRLRRPWDSPGKNTGVGCHFLLQSNGYIFPFLLCFSLLFFSQLFVRPPQITFLHFFLLGMVLIRASCAMSRTSIHSSSGTLSIISNPLNLFVPPTV